MTGTLQRITALRFVALAVVLWLLAVALLATIFFPLPYWIDVARLQISLLTVFGMPAALVAGRAPYRVALATVALIVGMAVQFMYGFVFEGPDCGSMLSETAIVIAFGPALLLYLKIVPVTIVIVAPLFAYGVLSRASPRVRLGAVAALLIAVFVAALIIGQVQAASMSHRCIDF